jgi:hypothetical protein
MNGFLSRWIRDAQGRVHDRGESVVIVRQIARADFDSRQMLVVRFADDSTGAVFSNEIELSPTMPDVRAC